MRPLPAMYMYRVPPNASGFTHASMVIASPLSKSIRLFSPGSATLMTPTFEVISIDLFSAANNGETDRRGPG